MKILLISGSQNPLGSTSEAVSFAEKTILSLGAEVIKYTVPSTAVACTGCGYCKKNGVCIVPDLSALYKNMKSLFKLDTNRVQGEREFGPMPTFAVWLISGVAVVWVGIASYLVIGRVKEKRRAKNGEKMNKP